MQRHHDGKGSVTLVVAASGGALDVAWASTVQAPMLTHMLRVAVGRRNGLS